MKINSAKLEIAMANKCIDSRALANKAGLAYSTIKRATQKEGSRPITIGKIAKALGVSVKDLL